LRSGADSYNEQVKEYMAPSAQAVKAVTDYFASEGVSAQPIAGHGDWIGFNTTVAQAGRLFNASFSTYHHVNTGTQHVRTMAYSVPAHLKEHIELVHPMTTCVSVQTPRVCFPLTGLQVHGQGRAKCGFQRA
jgi:tripeptidyl-peptidase-1